MKTSTHSDIKLPMDAETAKRLRLGEIITLSGMIFTGRSLFHIRAIEEGIVAPIDFSSINCFFHVGPVMRKTRGKWEIVSIEPTSSIRFNRYGADVIKKLGLRTVLGKTTMGDEVTQALKLVGGVYLSKVGICGNILGSQVRKIHNVYFLDELGKTEATWVFEVEKFGPFFVAIDAHGNNYFKILKTETDANLSCVKKQLGISENYRLTEVNG